MKMFFVFVSLVFFFSCSNDNSEKNTPDNDVDAFVEVEQNKDEFDSAADEDIEIKDDEASVVDDETSADEDNAAKPDETTSLCGTEDAVCYADDVATCEEILPGSFGHESPPCLDDCSGFDTSFCAMPYGSISINYSAEYLIDIMKSSDSTYVEQFADDIIHTEPLFYGNLGGVAFPGENFTDAEIYSYKHTFENEEGETMHEIIIKQLAWNGRELLAPTVEVNIPGIVEEGETYEFHMHPGGIKLVLYDGQKFQEAECTHGFGTDGSFTVTKAEKLEDIEGGALAFEGADIPFFHLSETPHGNLTEGFEGGAICERKGEK